MSGQKYSDEELGVLRSLFDSCDVERGGRIHINQLSGLLSRLGKSAEEIVAITEAASKVSDDDGQIGFEEFVSILEQNDSNNDAPFEGPDPKVMEFLRILEEYRIKCEEEGNYLEAGRANKQLGVLKKQEEKRQQKSIRARQLSERQDVQLAHNMQYSDFNSSWDKYLEEYDNMAQMYIQQMTERHATILLDFQKQLRQELAGKPPKWSKELLEQRRKQHINARNKNYAEAQKLKKTSDKTEEREKREMEQSQAIVFAKREAQFRSQQQSELHALLKRIECRRKEHIKQRQLDSKRLLQRNRNVQAVLETKQNLETQKLFTDIKKTLQNNGQAPQTKRLGRSRSSPMASQQMSESGGRNTGGGLVHQESSYMSSDDAGIANGGQSNISWPDQGQQGDWDEGQGQGQGQGYEEEQDPSFMQQGGPPLGGFGNMVYADESISAGGEDY